nr:hypothetical protein [Nocardioides sambongensis]
MLTTSLPASVVIAMSKVALSRGWSLLGNHQAAMCGSFMVTTSRRSASQFRSPCQPISPGLPW